MVGADSTACRVVEEGARGDFMQLAQLRQSRSRGGLRGPLEGGCRPDRSSSVAPGVWPGCVASPQCPLPAPWTGDA